MWGDASASPFCALQQKRISPRILHGLILIAFQNLHILQRVIFFILSLPLFSAESYQFIFQMLIHVLKMCFYILIILSAKWCGQVDVC